MVKERFANNQLMVSASEFKKNTLWVLWVWKHHIINRNLWLLRTPNECSWGWRVVLKGRKEAAFLAKKLLEMDRIRYYGSNCGLREAF